MEDQEYELVSSEEVDRLKREIEHLKSNPFVQNSSDLRLYDAVRNLNESVNKLCVLFENVNKQLMKEYQSGESPEAKLDKLLDQNRNIAEALVTFVSKNEQPEMQPVSQNQSELSNPNELPFPAIQQPLQMQGQMPPSPFVKSDATQRFNAPMQNIPMQNSQFHPVNAQFNQNPNMQQNQQRMNAPPMMQSTIPQNQTTGKFGFAGKVDPNYPTPDDFQSLGPPTLGEPINIEPKKKSFLGFGK